MTETVCAKHPIPNVIPSNKWNKATSRIHIACVLEHRNGMSNFIFTNWNVEKYWSSHKFAVELFEWFQVWQNGIRQTYTCHGAKVGHCCFAIRFLRQSVLNSNTIDQCDSRQNAQHVIHTCNAHTRRNEERKVLSIQLFCVAFVEYSTTGGKNQIASNAAKSK